MKEGERKKTERIRSVRDLVVYRKSFEAAMKIAYKNTQPSRDFLCLFDSYHGTTLGTIGASWVSTRTSGKLATSEAASPSLRISRPSGGVQPRKIR